MAFFSLKFEENFTTFVTYLKLLAIKYLLPLTLAIVLAWFYRHSIISMLPGEVGIASDLNVCGMIPEPVSVEIMPLASGIIVQHDDFFNLKKYEAELENGDIVGVDKSENKEPIARIKSGKDNCFQYMDVESSKKWYEHLYQMSQKIKLP